MGQSAPWEYWRVQFAERGICRWGEFDDMTVEDVQTVIAVWDGIARASNPNPPRDRQVRKWR